MAIQELSQRLYQEVQAGIPAHEGIVRILQTVEEQRECTVEELRSIVMDAAAQAFRNQQPEIQDALLQGLGEENWDMRTYAIMVRRLGGRGHAFEAWSLLKKCEQRFNIKFSSREKFLICRDVLGMTNGKRFLELMHQENPTDDIVRAFVQLVRASDLLDAKRDEEADKLAGQITLQDKRLHLRLGREMIKRGFVARGSALAKTATEETRGAFITLGNELLEAGHSREAADVIEPLIRLGIVRNPAATSLGYQLDALILLAKCAKHDHEAERKFMAEMERLQRTGDLPPEYCVRIMYAYEKGISFKPQKFSRVARYLGKKNHFRVKGDTKAKLRQTPVDTGQVGSQELPELDESGEATKTFTRLLRGGQIAQAIVHLSKFRGIPQHILRLYRRHIFSVLSKGTHPLEVWDAVLDADPKYREVFVLATKKLLSDNKIDDATGLFLRRHGGLLKNGRVFGQQLFETGKVTNDLPSRAAVMVLEAGHPKVALEILKPTLLNFISKNEQIPPHALQAFARCAAVDAEVRNEFLEQMRDYRKHSRIRSQQVNALLQIVFGEDEAAPSKMREARRVTQPNGGDESEEEYIGRVARSRFFQDPHAMLRAQPIDKTASLVTGKSRKPRKYGYH